MQPKLTEIEGIRLLGEAFVGAGVPVQEGYPFEVSGATVCLDGYDPQSRVGFEFVTLEAGDRKSFGEDVVAALEQKMEHGDAFILLIDEWDVADAEELSLAARRFLDELRSRGVIS